jgi:hypothetical protein
MKKITIDDNINMPVATKGSQSADQKLMKQAAKDQDDACCTVIDASDMVPQFKPMSVTTTSPDAVISTQYTGDKPDKQLKVAWFHKEPNRPKVTLDPNMNYQGNE